MADHEDLTVADHEDKVAVACRETEDAAPSLLCISISEARLFREKTLGGRSVSAPNH